MILSTSGWPDRSHLSHTGGDTEVAEHAENKAVKEGYWTTRWQDNHERAGKSDPGAGGREKIVGILVFIASPYLRMANAMPIIVSLENFFSRCPSIGLSCIWHASTCWKPLSSLPISNAVILSKLRE